MFHVDSMEAKGPLLIRTRVPGKMATRGQRRYRSYRAMMPSFSAMETAAVMPLT